MNVSLIIVLGKLLKLSEPQLSHVQSGDSSTCLALLVRLDGRGFGVCACDG